MVVEVLEVVFWSLRSFMVVEVVLVVKVVEIVEVIEVFEDVFSR